MRPPGTIARSPRRWALSRMLASLALMLCMALPGLAQSAAEEITRFAPAWKENAEQAEAKLANPGVTSDALEQVRRDLAAQRDAARDLRDRAQAMVDPLRGRLDALGPPPPEGETEAPQIAAQRAELIEQISAAEVPVKAAESAYRRAEEIVRRIDAVTRERFRDELLTIQDSPLSLTALTTTVTDVSERARLALRDAAAGLGRAGSAVWPALAMGALGLFMLVAVRRFVTDRLEQRLARVMTAGRISPAGRALLDGFGRILSAAIIPGLGLFLLIYAVRHAGMVNGAAAPLIRDLPWFGGAMLLSYWLSGTLFGTSAPSRALFPLAPGKADKARRQTLLLGLAYGLDLLLIDGGTAAWLSLPTLSVINLGLMIVGGWALYRLAGAIAPTEPLPSLGPDGDDETDPRARLGRTIRNGVVQISRLVGLAAPVLAAIGFYAGSRYIFFPFLMSGALLGTAIVLVALVNGAIEASEDPREGGAAPSRLSLLPVLAGFVLAIVALPVLALIWGARESDISETWRILIDGIAIGEMVIRPLDFLTFLAVFAAGYYLTRLIQGLLRVTVLPQTSLDSGGQKAVSSMAGYVGVTLAVLAAISFTGLDLTNLAFVAGALSVGIGFGLQNVVSNFISGLILLIERPIKEGDWIKVGETEGTVRRIAVRATAIQTFDRAIVTVPNADFITSTVMNRTHRSTMGRIIVRVGVAYGTDTRMVEKLLSEAAEPCEYLLPRPAPIVVFTGFGADALDFAIYCYLRDVNTTLAATNDMNHRVADALREAGIEIPFAQRDLHLRNAEDLARAFAALGREEEEPARDTEPRERPA